MRDDPGLLDNSSGSLFASDAGTKDSSAFCSATALVHRLFLLCRGSIVLLPDGASVTYAAEAI